MFELQKNKLEENHPNILSSMGNLVIRYSKAGRGLEALQLLKKVLELRKNKLKEDYSNILKSIYNLAVNYSEARRGLEAL